jgi:dsDNA-binding SOS-regulon protein
MQQEADRCAEAYMLERQLNSAHSQVAWLQQSAVSGAMDEMQVRALSGQLALAISQRDTLTQKLHVIRQQQQAAQSLTSWSTGAK